MPRVNKLLNENKELLQQDGKARETFISNLDWREQTRIDKYEELLMKTKRWIITAIGDLSAMFDERPTVEDCTTMPQRGERKKYDYEQSM